MVEITAEEIERIKDIRKSNPGISEHGVTLFECPICQKQFAVHSTTSWLYRRKWYKALLTMCSYPCTVKFDRITGKE